MNNHFYRRVLASLLWCGWFALTGALHAAQTTVDARLAGAPSLSLSPYITTLEDSGLSLTLADVQKTEVLSRFLADPSAAEALNYGYTRSAYWLRLVLHNPTDNPLERMLEIRYPSLASIQLHQPTAEGGYRSVITGIVTPFEARPHANRYFVFPLTLPAQAQQAVYLRVQSPGPVTIPAFLWEPTAFHAYERADYAAQAAYFGAAAAMILSALLFFVALRDKAYCLYVVFVTCMTLALATQNGLSNEFLWTNSPRWSNIATNVGYSLSLAALLVFMRHMLNTRKVIPYSDRVLLPLIGLFLISPIAFAIALPTIIKSAAMVYGATAVLILGIGLWCVYKGQRSAYFFVASFSALCLAAIASVLRAMGLLPTNVFTMNALQFGAGVQMLLLALSLADRFNAMRKANALTQAKALHSKQRLVEVLQASERVLEQRVQQRTSELDRKNQNLKTALSVMETVERIARHDLKTPLGSLVAAPALLRAGRVMDAKEETILRMMESAAKRAQSMVTLSLDLYRMESGTYTFNPARVALNALVRSVLQDLSAQAQSKAVTINVSAPTGPVFAHAEEQLCYSIIANLMKNAVEAAPAHTEISVELRVDAMACVCIHNQGAVPLELREHFFDKYATSGTSGGIGLGTYSSLLLTQAQGGSLTMQTSDTQGTTLTLILQREVPADDSHAPQAHGTTDPEVKPSAKQTLTMQRVLIVDDDEFNRMILMSYLPQPPLAVESAINGHDALEKVKIHRPDLIVMDIEMPIMGGIQALLDIRAFQSSAAQAPSFIVAYSGNNDTQSQTRYLAHGFDKCLSKPASQQQLRALLR